MRAPSLLAILACVLTPSTGMAQHGGAAGASALRPELASCIMCHDTHTPEQTAYTLRLSDVPFNVTGARVVPADLDPTSRSCLRCHITPETRSRQPEFYAGAAAGRQNAFYLGPSLDDDHPIGRIERAPTRPLGENAGAARFVAPGFRSFMTRGLAEERNVSCTTCHDPHARAGFSPSPEAQTTLCGSCHSGATYAGGNHASLACGDCHKIHGGNAQLVAEPITDILCNSCHQATGVAFGRRGARQNLPHAPAGHDRSMGDSCLSCHAAHH